MMGSYSSLNTRIKEGFEHLKSDFSRFKDTTARLNIVTKQRLGFASFDQENDVNNILILRKSHEASSRSFFQNQINNE